MYLWLDVVVDETTHSNSNIMQPFLLKDAVHSREIVDISLSDFDVRFLEQFTGSALCEGLAIL